MRGANKYEMIGEQYGRLTVIEIVEKYKKNQTYCRCICDCGNEKVILASNVKRGLTRSCGCLERESRFARCHDRFYVGEQVNDFTLIEKTDKRARNGSAIWKLQCKCGNIIEASPSQIKHANKKSCGCDYVNPLLIDLTGQKYGMLTVVRIHDQRVMAGRRVAWECRCDCGNKVVVASFMLRSGKTTSCGCKNKSIKIELIKKRLDSLGIEYCLEYRFEDCKDKRALPFDIYIPSSNVVIEYDGRQHYESVPFWGGNDEFELRARHDAIKKEYCVNHDITMIRIPYYLTDNEITKIIDELEPVTSKCYAEQSA